MKINEKLSRNNSIMVLKQDKGRGVVVIDRKTYTEKCLNLLNTDSFYQYSVRLAFHNRYEWF